MIDDYSGLQKAAILLITLGPEKASAISGLWSKCCDYEYQGD